MPFCGDIALNDIRKAETNIHKSSYIVIDLSSRTSYT